MVLCVCLCSCGYIYIYICVCVCVCVCSVNHVVVVRCSEFLHITCGVCSWFSIGCSVDLGCGIQLIVAVFHHTQFSHACSGHVTVTLEEIAVLMLLYFIP